MGRTLTLGFVQRPHGVRGLVRVRLDLEDTSWLVPGVELLVGSTPRELSRFGAAPGGPPSYLIGLLGVGDRSAAEALWVRRLRLSVPHYPTSTTMRVTTSPTSSGSAPSRAMGVALGRFTTSLRSQGDSWRGSMTA